MNKSIPTINEPKIVSLPVAQIPKADKDRLLFSFELLEDNEYFGLSSSCDSWTKELFEMLKDVSKVSFKELVNNKYQKYRFHNHKNANPPCKMPDNVSKENSYQLRISQSKGGIHGVLVGEVFYVFWLDPLHNMYPNENYGGPVKIKSLDRCCLFVREKMNKLYEENLKLKEENTAFHEIYDNE